MKKFVLLVAVGLTTLITGSGSGQTLDCVGYTYAGIRGSTPVYGVSANIVVKTSPKLDNNPSSHSVAWIGLSRERQSWIQAGIAQGNSLYYEIGSPELDGGYSIVFLGRVEIGESRRFAVLATANQPDSWRVWLDGKPVSPVIRLPNFGWRTTYAGAENRRSENGCNEFSYEFGNVRTAKVPGGIWRPIRRYTLRKDAPYQISFISGNSFRASYP